MKLEKKDLLIVALFIIVFVLVGIMGYSSFKNSNVNNNEEQVANSEDVSIVMNKLMISELLLTNNIDVTQNFKNEVIKIDDLTFKVNCKDYDKDLFSCESVELIYKDKVLEVYTTTNESSLIVTNKQIITLQGNYLATMKIYDYDANLKYDKEVVTYYYKDFGGKDISDLELDIKDNKLYYYTCVNCDDANYTESNKATIYKNFIDLKAYYIINDLEKFQGYVANFFAN